ncbi:hypothetical protein BKA70DRAFT_1431441 [Coprinopsis sp. MPI-PUGE-AT-0042]|nr:hypothetical protein BKA70DRAFT_1431441 [Coprinopsis sp. MPI-PUGE-AT-0042]
MKRNMVLNFLAYLFWPFMPIPDVSKREEYLKERIASLWFANQALLQKESVSVSQYLLILMGCTNHGRSGWADSRTVRKIHFYKNHLRWSEQEYLVLECKFDLCEEPFHLLVEWFHGSDTKPLETSMEPTTATLSSSAAGPNEGWHPVRDRIRRITSLEVLNHLTPIAVYKPPITITLPEVCRLLDLLHKRSESSALHRSQCIWLGDAVWAILENRHGNSSGISIPLLAPSGAARCSQMPLVTPETEGIEQISGDLDVKLANSIQRIESSEEW